MSTYINEGTNIDIGVEFNKIRLEIVKDKAAFNTAIRNKDYKTARYIAYKINKKCDEFYDKLEKLDITKSEAIIGTLAKATYDAGITVAAIAGTMELVIKSVEVNKGVDFTKSQKQRIRNAVYKDNESKSVLAGVIAAGALEGTVNVLLKLYNKISNSKDIEPKDLNAYYVTIKQKMKVICAKAKLLPNQVDVLEKRYGAEEKRKELEKNVKDSKNMLNESEEAIMDKDLLDIALESSDVFATDEYMTETFSNPIRKFKKRIEEIKDEKPGESDTPKDVKDFVDKNYDKLIAASKILEKEPDKLTKADILDSIACSIGLIGAYAGPLAAVAAGAESAAAIGISIVPGGLLLIGGIIGSIITWVRRNNDVTVVKNLTKVKASLQKLNTKKLSPDTKKKVEKLIEKISDAETDIYAKIKNVKESADPEILAVYKECAEGHITEEQREDIITSIRNQRSASAIIEEAQVDEDSTLKDKFNEIKRIAYERCENGEFSEDTREEIINAAYNKLFNATEEVDIAKAEPVKDDPSETKKEIDEMNKNIDKEMNANKA